MTLIYQDNTRGDSSNVGSQLNIIAALPRVHELDICSATKEVGRSTMRRVHTPCQYVHIWMSGSRIIFSQNWIILSYPRREEDEARSIYKSFALLIWKCIMLERREWCRRSQVTEEEVWAGARVAGATATAQPPDPGHGYCGSLDIHILIVYTFYEIIRDDIILIASSEQYSNIVIIITMKIICLDAKMEFMHFRMCVCVRSERYVAISIYKFE